MHKFAHEKDENQLYLHFWFIDCIFDLCINLIIQEKIHNLKKLYVL